MSLRVGWARFLLFWPLGAAAAGPGVELSDAWVRALPPSQHHTAAYLRLYNAGEHPRRVLAASAGEAGRVEFHHSREVDGLQRMEQLPELALGPGARLELVPGGIHLMLLELPRMPAPGERLPLCLTLDGGERLCTEAEVRREAPAPGDPAHHQHH